MKTCKNLKITSDKKKRVRSRACALTRHMNDYRKIRLNEQRGWLAPARQLTPSIIYSHYKFLWTYGYMYNYMPVAC